MHCKCLTLKKVVQPAGEYHSQMR